MTDRERHPQPLPLLTWLAVKGLASDDDIARRLGADPAISSLLRQLVTDGVVEHQAGFFVLTEHGDQTLSSGCRDALSASEQDEFAAFLPAFESIDAELKRVATQWQLANRRAQDGHDDAVLDAVEALLHVDGLLRETSRASAAVVGEVLSPYLDALDSAREAVVSGAPSAFTGADDASYHSVWFVMHEIILRTAGRSR